MHHRDVIVIGGGLAGLTAGLSAALEGARTTVLEAVSEAGGRARTRVEEGFYFNMGPHALYAKAAGMEALRELGITPRGAAPGQSGAMAFAGGGAYTLPAGFVSLLATGLLDLGEKIELGRFLATLPKLDAARFDAVPLGEALQELLRRPRNRQLAAALVRLTTYGHDTAHLSAGAAIRQLQHAAAGGVLYLDGGWQALVDALADAARRRGAKLECGVRARRVARDASGRWQVEVEGRGPLAADAVVLAAGPREARRLVEDGEDPALARLEADALPVRLASLDLGLRRLPRPRSSFALGIDEPTYVSVHSATARLAPDGAALVHACRYLAPGEAPQREAVRGEIEAALSRLQPGWREEVARAHYQPGLLVAHALPRADRGGLAGRPGPALAGHPGLFLAGDWVGDRGLLADAALASGRRAGLAAAAAPARGARAA
jgi:phytoene dehydrogenase-like protein